MIEGINTSLASTQVSRAVVDKVSTEKSLTTNPNRIQQVQTSVRYISPHVKVDMNSAMRVVTQFRDNDSGEVLRQYPTESQMQAYSKAQQFAQQSQSNEIKRAIAAAELQQRVEAIQNTSSEPVSEPVVSTPAPTPTPAAPAPAVEAAPQPATTEATTAPISDVNTSA